MDSRIELHLPDYTKLEELGISAAAIASPKEQDLQVWIRQTRLE